MTMTSSSANIDPFEITRSGVLNSQLVYTPQWAMQFVYNGDITDVAWCQITSTTNNFADYGVRIRVNGVIVDDRENQESFEVAKTLRKQEVYKELLEGKKADILGDTSFYNRDDIADATETLWKRASTGEFVGQFNSSMIYVQEVASILGIHMSKVLEAIDGILVPQKRIGLNGMILTTWESQEGERAFLEEKYGHKNMSLSDFGYWGCSACGKHGDDYDNPKDYPCEPKSETPARSHK